MTNTTNNNAATHELSIEELDSVAGGNAQKAASLFQTRWFWIKRPSMQALTSDG